MSPPRSEALFPFAGLALAYHLAAAVIPFDQPMKSPQLFHGGSCADEPCAFGRWVEFLKKHDQPSRPPGPTFIRYIALESAPECPAGAAAADGVHVVTLSLNDDGRLFRQAADCGVRKTGKLSADETRRILATLDAPALHALDGSFPAYCREDEEAEQAAHVLEIGRDQRYQLIEWDCDVPPALKPLLDLLEPDA